MHPIPLPQDNGSPEPFPSDRFRVHPRNQGAGLGTSSRRALARHRFRLGHGPSTTWVPPNEPRLPCRAGQAAPCARSPSRASLRTQTSRSFRIVLLAARSDTAARPGVSLPLVPKYHFGRCSVSRVIVRLRTHGHVGRGCDPSGRRRRSRGSPRTWSRCVHSSSPCERPTEISVSGPLADDSCTQCFGGGEPRSPPLLPNDCLSRSGSISMSTYSQALRSYPRAFHG